VPPTDHGHLSPATLEEILLEARNAGFLGPGPIAPHLRHAEGFVRLARTQTPPSPTPDPRILDLGSGGGLPGLVLAAEWPEAEVVLLDANERRTEFLERAVVRCGFSERVSVVHQRAELSGRDPRYRGAFDGVAVRSFGSPAVVAECAAPFLRPGGWLIVSEPPGISGADGSSVRWPAGALAQFGLEPGESVRADFGYQVLRQREPCPDRFPRRNGVPAKNPLF
jgi:16S rRNA (guanine527-N7)-methyltransferase